MLTLFSIITLTLHAHAQTIAPHRAQIDAIRTLSKNNEPACPKTAPRDGKVLVVFDGMKGFCPRVAAARLPLWNEQDSLTRYAVDELSEKDFTNFDQFVVDQQNFFHRCYLLTPLVEATRGSSDIPPMLYYSLHGASDATDCLKSLRQKTEAAGKTLSVSFLGYSLGGSAVLKTVQNMRATGAVIDTVVTIDPVAPNFRVLKATVGDGNSDFFKRPSYAKQWLNLYQHEDHSALTKGIVVPIGIRGSVVEGADLNLQLHPTPRGYLTPHSTILDTYEATQLIYQMVGIKQISMTTQNPQTLSTPEGLKREFSTPEN